MILFNIIILIFLLSFLFILLWNFYVLDKNRKTVSDKIKLPFVSILVPMRNEEKNAEKCLNSLLQIDYPSYEIIVLNDNSSDSTGSILSGYSLNNSKIRVIENHTLPEGWIGKNYACEILAENAGGDYLLFTDADTTHSPDSLRKAMMSAINNEADLLSVLPKQITDTLSEKIIVPFLYFVLLVCLPFFMIKYNRFPRFSAAIGQYMLFKRSAYEKIGGHASVRESVIEDVHLAKKIKKNKMKLVLCDGADIVSCRMYSGIKDIFLGFKKNISSGLGNSLILIVIIEIIFALLFLLPFFEIVFHLFQNESSLFIFYLLLSEIIVIYIMRYLLFVKFKQSFISLLLHPFGILVLMILLVCSYWESNIKKEVVWKNRKYKV